MALDRDQIREQLIKCLLQMSSVKNLPPIDEQTNPMWKLGLDSHDGVNLACKLTAELNCEVPVDVNPLVDDKRNRPRRIGEIVDLICALAAKEGAQRT